MPDRDAKGRFIKGNQASPGRKPRQTETHYMEITLSEVTPEYWAAITRRAIMDAIKGLPEARRWLSDYVLGKPPQILELRGADAKLLADVLKAFEQRGQSASAVFHAMLAEIASDAEIGKGRCYCHVVRQ